MKGSTPDGGVLLPGDSVRQVLYRVAEVACSSLGSAERICPNRKVRPDGRLAIFAVRVCRRHRVSERASILVTG